MTVLSQDRVRDYFSDASVHQNVPDYLADLRSLSPVYREPHHGAVMVTGYDAALEAFTTKAAALSSANSVTGPLPPLPFVPEGDDLRDQVAAHRPAMPWTDHLVTLDGQAHAAHRLFLTQLLTHSRLKANEEYVYRLIAQLVDRVIDKGGCEITKDYAHALSTLVIADLLGVPEGERGELVELLGAPATQLGGDTEEKSLSDPLTFLYPRFERYLAERRAAPSGDMMSDLAASQYRDGTKPEPATLIRLACFLFGAGQDTSARLIAFCFRILGDYPEVQARLRGEPEKIPLFIEEVLRFENPVKVVSRLAITPLTLGGVRIAAGEPVIIHLGGANRDPAHFADPDRFDYDRPNVRDHISFSRGAHGCLGAPLARMEARNTLERFLARTSDIRISEARHGSPGARCYVREEAYLLNGLKELHVEWDRA